MSATTGTTPARRFQLCTIEPTRDITGDRPNGSEGTLVLSRYDDTFMINWTPMSSTSLHHLSALPQNPIQDNANNWDFNAPFSLECQKISIMQLHPDLSLSIFSSDKTQERRFHFAEMEFISVTELVEQLLINGIAVPCKDKEYSLQFYRRCHRGVYPYTPPHIQLAFDSSTDLQAFWDCLHEFFLTLIIHLDQSDTLPKDPQFPLGDAARAAHARVLDQVYKYIESLPQLNKITAEEWPSLFDEEGKLKELDVFRERLFRAGIENEILSNALPFAFGIYDINSTKAERDALDKELSDEFDQFSEQVTSLTPNQIENNKKVSAAFRVIKHDVSRTDRQLPAFKNKKAPGLKMVTRLLKTYCIFNPPIGYLQGMNDLFVPIILSFLPKWNEEGAPIDDDGNIIDHQPYMSSIFWCFDAMLRNIDHLQLLASVTEQCQKQAEGIFQIMLKVSPLAAIWMRRNHLKDLLWCYSDFVLLFKRSFPDIWAVWLQLNCSQYPSTWLAYFVAAILLHSFDELASLQDVTIPVMMENFPRILSTLKLEVIGATSLWLAEKVKPNVKPKPDTKPDISNTHFKFFETTWTGPSETRLSCQ